MLTASGGGLAGIDVADNDDVDVTLLLTVAVVRRCSFDVSSDGWEAVARSRALQAQTYPILSDSCLFW